MADVLRSDYEEIVEDVSVQLQSQLNAAETGTIIDLFHSDTLDPAQNFLFFGATERALLEYRKGHNKKTVFVRVQPEGLATAEPVATPVSALLDRLILRRMDEFMHDKIFVEDVFYNGEQIVYSGADLKNRHVVLLIDGIDEGSPYLTEVIALCEEMKAKFVVAVPLVIWSQAVQERLAAELNEEGNTQQGIEINENTPVS